MAVDYCDRDDVEDVAGIDNVAKWADLDNDIATLAGTLSTRTDDDTGIVTVDTGHGVTTSDKLDVLWGSGHRYGMTVTGTTGTTISVDGGSGDALPVQDSPVNVRLNDKIAARIAKAITKASTNVDSLMLGGLYTIPLEQIASADAPELIVEITSVKAAVWLYERRGVEDYDAENETSKHRLAFQKDEADAKINEIRAHVRQLDAKKLGKTYPFAHDFHTEARDRRNT